LETPWFERKIRREQEIIRPPVLPEALTPEKTLGRFMKVKLVELTHKAQGDN